MNSMGFLAKNEKIELLPRNKDFMVKFDSGEGISLADANTHTLVLGTTGSGKTSNVVLPSLYSMLKNGLCGLIIDIKGNLSDQVRLLATEAGRQNDIIEFGTSPRATPLNYFADMNDLEVHETLETITLQSFDGKSNNLDFYVRGIKQACELVLLLKFIAKKNPKATPTLKLLAQLLTNNLTTSKLYQMFKNNIYDEKNYEQSELVNSIEANRHHICHYEKNVDTTGRNSYIEQLNYEVSGIRTALLEFFNSPDILQNFSGYKAKGLDLTELLLQNKIVILRFEPGSGRVGASLARTLVEKYYKSIYSLGVLEAQKHPSFICLDEFQDIVDLSGNKYSDMNFISQAREFGVRFLASTQSCSSLDARAKSTTSVDSFVSNCNNKIIFHTDDPHTQNVVSRYADDVVLNTLLPSQAFVVQYISEERTHKHSLEYFEKSYAETKELLNNTALKENPRRKKADKQELKELFEELNKVYPSDNKTENNDANHARREELLEKIRKLKGAKQGKGSTNAKTTQKKGNNFSTKLKRDFAEFFAQNDREIVVYPGWQDMVYKALTAFKDLNFPIQISGFKVRNRALEVSIVVDVDDADRDTHYTAGKTLDFLLEETMITCIYCGANIKESMEKSPIFLPCCQVCSSKYNLSFSTEEKEERGISFF